MSLRRFAILVGAAGLLVALAASLQAQAPAQVVALRALPRGAVLQPADVGGADAASVVGFETQRVIAAGEALRAPAIAPAAAVRAGDSVTVRVETGGVAVSRMALALATARIGQPVRVRLGLHSLSGIVTAPGVVRLP
jgi:flagella basal body P-ring formation protein FlgA